MQELQRATSAAKTAVKRKMQLSVREIDGYGYSDDDDDLELLQWGYTNTAGGAAGEASSGRTGTGQGVGSGRSGNGAPVRDAGQGPQGSGNGAPRYGRRRRGRGERSHLTQAELDALLADDSDFCDDVRLGRDR